MHQTATLTFDSEQMTPLDDAALASIIGGEEGIKDWLVNKVIGLLFDCLTGSIDEIISAAEEGYQDAR